MSRLQEPRSLARDSTEHTLDDYSLTSPPGSPHKPALQDSKHKHKPSQSSTSSRPLSPTNVSALQDHARSSPPRESSPTTVDVDAGKIPKTWTRNSIRIPVRTRYVISVSGQSSVIRVINFRSAAILPSRTSLPSLLALRRSYIACPVPRSSLNPVGIHSQFQNQRRQTQ